MPVKTDNEELTAYAKEICDALEAKDVRVELDDRSEKLGYRMREGQVQKVPYLLVVGFNEKEDRTVSSVCMEKKIPQFFHWMSLWRSLRMRSKIS